MYKFPKGNVTPMHIQCENDSVTNSHLTDSTCLDRVTSSSEQYIPEQGDQQDLSGHHLEMSDRSSDEEIHQEPYSSQANNAVCHNTVRDHLKQVSDGYCREYTNHNGTGNICASNMYYEKGGQHVSIALNGTDSSQVSANLTGEESDQIVTHVSSGGIQQVSKFSISEETHVSSNLSDQNGEKLSVSTDHSGRERLQVFTTSGGREGPISINPSGIEELSVSTDLNGRINQHDSSGPSGEKYQMSTDLFDGKKQLTSTDLCDGERHQIIADGEKQQVFSDISGDRHQGSIDLNGEKKQVCSDISEERHQCSIELNDEKHQVSKILSSERDQCSIQVNGDKQQVSPNLSGETHQGSIEQNGEKQQVSTNLSGERHPGSTELNEENEQAFTNLSGEKQKVSTHLEGKKLQVFTNLHGERHQVAKELNGNSAVSTDCDGEKQQVSTDSCGKERISEQVCDEGNSQFNITRDKSVSPNMSTVHLDVGVSLQLSASPVETDLIQFYTRSMGEVNIDGFATKGRLFRGDNLQDSANVRGGDSPHVSTYINLGGHPNISPNYGEEVGLEVDANIYQGDNPQLARKADGCDGQQISENRSGRDGLVSTCLGGCSTHVPSHTEKTSDDDSLYHQMQALVSNEITGMENMNSENKMWLSISVKEAWQYQATSCSNVLSIYQYTM